MIDHNQSHHTCHFRRDTQKTMVDHGSQCGKKSPEASFVDESEEEGDVGDIDNEEKENGNLQVADSIPNRVDVTLSH